jgi:hypothetical protein
MSRCAPYFFALAALCAGCSSYTNTVKYQQASGVVNQINDHDLGLRHTPAGSYTYEATSQGQGKVLLSVAGVTNHDDQDQIIKVLESHRFDTHRDWDSIEVRFYEKAAPTPQGVNYVNLLREQRIEP